MKKKKIIIGSIVIVLVVVVGVTFSILSKTKTRRNNDIRHATYDIQYYTCGMHPSVKVSVEEYNKGNKSCPICNMYLTAVYKEESESKKVYYGCGVDTDGKCPHCDLGQADAKCICGGHSFMIKGTKIDCPVCGKPLEELTQEEADKLKGVVSRVKIKGDQAKLAGVKTGLVSKVHLYKEIRTVGKVAYDPDLAIAEEEFISSLRAVDKMKQGLSSEIEARAVSLLESSKRKLRLLGLSKEQIVELEKERKVHTSYILPEEKMWIYSDVYEYELGWVKQGEKVRVTTTSLPGEEFHGVISSVNPVFDAKTRSVKFRAEVDNPGLKLQPEMYVDVVIMSMYAGSGGEHMVLAVPKDAVLDTGIRKIVWLDPGNGEYEGRVIEIGPEATGQIEGKVSKFYPVLRGLTEGERVVTKANFLVDSQSQISGVAASAYGGALGAEEKKKPPVHQH